MILLRSENLDVLLVNISSKMQESLVNSYFHQLILDSKVRKKRNFKKTIVNTEHLFSE